MSQALAGFVAQMYVSTTFGGVYTLIGELREYSISIERDTIDVSSHSSVGWKDNILGLAQWSGSAEYLYVAADTPQDTLYDSLINRELLYFRFRPKGDAATIGDDEWSGSGYVTSWEISASTEDAQAASIELLGAGALTRTTLT